MISYTVVSAVLLLVCLLFSHHLSSDNAEREQKILSGIDDLLPQTQCQQCGFSGCKPYADAISKNAAPINRCPPGGLAVANAIADLIGAERVGVIEPVNPVHGNDQPVIIDEQACIGCTKCLPACPVDAIIGAQKQVHIVLADVCTGCGLCVPPCPVDCISFVSESSA